jgi:hypothetical protein
MKRGILSLTCFIVELLVGRPKCRRGKCPFCDRGPQEQGAIAETRLAYLKLVDGQPGRYLIVAKFHWVTPYDLPITWWWHVQTLLRVVDGRIDNTSQNWTPEGGRTVEHVHLWVIVDRAKEDGLPCKGTGMAGLIDNCLQSAGRL